MVSRQWRFLLFWFFFWHFLFFEPDIALMLLAPTFLQLLRVVPIFNFILAYWLLFLLRSCWFFPEWQILQILEQNALFIILIRSFFHHIPYQFASLWPTIDSFRCATCCTCKLRSFADLFFRFLRTCLSPPTVPCIDKHWYFITYDFSSLTGYVMCLTKLTKLFFVVIEWEWELQLPLICCFDVEYGIGSSYLKCWSNLTHLINEAKKCRCRLQAITQKIVI